MPLDRQDHSPRGWRGGPPHRPNPQLPAFCRTRRPTTMVSTSSLRAIHRLLLLVLLVQLSTLLLVIAGPVPPRPAASTSSLLRPDADTARGGASPVTPRPYR